MKISLNVLVDDSLQTMHVEASSETELQVKCMNLQLELKSQVGFNKRVEVFADDLILW